MLSSFIDQEYNKADRDLNGKLDLKGLPQSTPRLSTSQRSEREPVYTPDQVESAWRLPDGGAPDQLHVVAVRCQACCMNTHK